MELDQGRGGGNGMAAAIRGFFLLMGIGAIGIVIFLVVTSAI